jgi:hypothetical protein
VGRPGGRERRLADRATERGGIEGVIKVKGVAEGVLVHRREGWMEGVIRI